MILLNLARVQKRGRNSCKNKAFQGILGAAAHGDYLRLFGPIKNKNAQSGGGGPFLGLGPLKLICRGFDVSGHREEDSLRQKEGRPQTISNFRIKRLFFAMNHRRSKCF